MRKSIIIRLLMFFVFATNMFAFEKPIFLLLYTDTCPHCQSFLNNTMSNMAVKNILSNFEVEAINVNKQQYIPYDIDFTGTVPSIHLLDSNHVQMANTLTGNIPAQELVPALNKFLDLYSQYRSSVK
ncbi:hypothetical protein A9K75_06560 [Campylobacter fetus subsp. testudinum]|uniref:thioredoxin family protein n=1 Tax=Campylobacter fetus TaxID=196 RepID=UPI00081899E6|nr:thioredoxin family protein [Campylobacter fetus]OCR99527.1 hypothetical protein A9K75_06560 [Campylobacter fetus subsp. testudinum]